MARFVRGEVDVLVSTMIVESGLDVPNANTMIVNRADQLGLAQLYQLRGRVGRSHRRAYCYLLVPDLVDEEAEERHRGSEETRLNSSHSQISYAVFCLKKKKQIRDPDMQHG